MKTLPDNELNAELQELYLTGKQWLSDVEFLNNEQRFLVSVTGQINYFSLPGGYIGLADDLQRAEKAQQQLQLRIIKFMAQLEPLISRTNPNIDLHLVEDFCALQTDVATVSGHLKTIKHRMVAHKTVN